MWGGLDRPKGRVSLTEVADPSNRTHHKPPRAVLTELKCVVNVVAVSTCYKTYLSVRRPGPSEPQNRPEMAALRPPHMVERSSEISGIRNRGGGPAWHTQGVQVKTLILNIQCLPKGHHVKTSEPKVVIVEIRPNTKNKISDAAGKYPAMVSLGVLLYAVVLCKNTA